MFKTQKERLAAVSIPIWYGLNKETDTIFINDNSVSIPIWYGLNSSRNKKKRGI